MKKLIFAIVIATLSVPAHGQEPSGQGNFLQRLGDTIRNIPRGGKPELTDDAKCRSYGAVPGSDAYVSCRVQLETARTSAPAPAYVPFRDPETVTCVGAHNTVTCNQVPH